MNNNEALWVEKYRPVTVGKCILPKALTKIFDDFVVDGDIPNLLLAGNPGCGKTSVALALCKTLDYDMLMINGSIEGRNIDTIRTTITSFASTVSLFKKRKVIIIDEADYMNPESVQPALRGFIEKYAKNCRFIFTCNTKMKIFPAIRSRCTVIEFTLPVNEKKDIASKFLKTCETILTVEKVSYEKKVIAKLISKHFPDFRRTINELQKHGCGGSIDESILETFLEVELDTLFKAMKAKDFWLIRSWVTANIANDPAIIYRKIYDSLKPIMKPQSLPQAVLHIGNYQYQSAFCMDQEINLVCCLLEISADCEFI